MSKQLILKSFVDVTSYEMATQKIISWSKLRESRSVCAANVHMIMEAYNSKDFQQILNKADMVTPDGMPLVWSLRLMGFSEAKRVYGPDLMLHTLAAAEKNGIPVGFYGGSEQTISKLLQMIARCFPNLQIPYSYSPPFRDLTPEEDANIISELKSSEIGILFVCLGCPKQEIWMEKHKSHFDGVMLGVGAAFDFLAGTKPQAPSWMMRMGLEWLFRLFSEPKRLWHRYIFNNPRFLFLSAGQILCFKLSSSNNDK